MSLTKQYDVTVWLGGNIGQLGTFDTLSGGGVDSDEVKWHPGGMSPTITLGGTSEVENVVVSRLYLLERDHPRVGRLLDQAGKIPMLVVKQPLDGEGNVWGSPLIYAGTYKRCTPPEHDSNATDGAVIELELSAATVALG